ncbi:MAG: M23 family metallopeptidase [Alphaproteobacteria bacterium]|nr:MAG: M23 family metallopeptidase [Alphaproteobacteria bacterium]
MRGRSRSAAGVGGPYAPIATVSSSRLAATEPETSRERLDLANDILPSPSSASDDLPFAPELRSLAQTLDVKRRVIDLLESLPRTKPVIHYYISSRFGPRRDPFRKRRSMHYGLDMAGWRGEPIRAVAPGVVIKAGRAPAYGLMVEIDHGNGYHTRYGHMRRLFVRKGDTVVPGKRIGSMGSTGRSTSTHLHWEVWYHGRPVDPLPYLKAIADVETLRKEFERRNDGQG